MCLNLIQLQRDFKKNRKISNILAFRLIVLIELAKGINIFSGSYSDATLSQVATKNKRSPRTLSRWVRFYTLRGWKGLLPKKHRPKKRVRILKWMSVLIINYRTQYNWGAETIQAHLLRDHNVALSLFKIHQLLKNKGFIKKRKRKKLKNKHIKIVQVQDPGTHTQTDVKHLPRLLLNKTYVYNFVDHASRWEFKLAFDSYNPRNTKIFFQEVVRHAPFPITSAQTDNGVEFTYKWITLAGADHKNEFEIFLTENNIRHRLIPPGEKELNGLVERSHRADDEELYHRIKPKDLNEFNRILKDHTHWRNQSRRKKALEWKTTMEWLLEYRGKQNIKIAA